MWQLSYQCSFKKKTSQNWWILYSCFNIEGGRKKKCFWHIMLYYFKKDKNTTEMHKKRFVQCTEKVLWLIEHVRSGIQSFMLEISRWTIFHCQIDQLKLIAVNSNINWEQSMLHHGGDSSQNILRISKSDIENHLYQLGYVIHFDVWLSHKLSEKTFLLSWSHFCMQFST